MNLPRSSGILLHPTSLPNRYGIGDLGKSAYKFIDFLHNSGCKLWQTLPLGPTGYGDSPYQSFSTFAGNPYLISPDLLLEEDLLHPNDLKEELDFDNDLVDYGRVISWKLNLLERAFIRFERDPKLGRRNLDIFREKNSDWLEDYALFMALKEANGGGSWIGWDESLRNREKAALAKAREELKPAIDRFTFYQFLFFRQWDALRMYAKEKNIQIIGDIPIFVSYDSSDVWANPELFFIDEKKLPTVVAGVPPDYFSETGQLWGNPLYKWKKHKAENYVWWVKRMSAVLNMVDVVRLDHFRGFAGYWEVPAKELTAVNGRWVPGPGADIFERLKDELGGLPIIAEDLGEITPDVFELRDQFNLPGMKIFQFAFSDENNPFLPHHYPENCVAYTGTHDNDTARGWYESASEYEKDFARRYLSVDGSDFAWDLIRSLWHSRANFVLAPMQDLLSLGTEARMNYPGRLGGNWGWRMKEDEMSDALLGKLKKINERAGRIA
ncbi:MAG: 4-alpha-glucanotransferase [Anaerolineae bacterium]|jgi:4-alpha-glucanotransferase|nr:4-alpha-glucanotransferase [Anaerolineae bacterium]MBT3713483.1 4-alpha-glucanotransferase [Anaerolineae bacterium]MBT4458543.1 4-alpha-glucanotransferase [Anaerolineae bacterium]MBT4842719.1 4-alpha-glucanotransferase [Anaerolineae bacterium]MBT6063128.1 4-alpha-glucanotransferase [Anaerolineae bacterium]